MAYAATLYLSSRVRVRNAAVKAEQSATSEFVPLKFAQFAWVPIAGTSGNGVRM